MQAMMKQMKKKPVVHIETVKKRNFPKKLKFRQANPAATTWFRCRLDREQGRSSKELEAVQKKMAEAMKQMSTE